MSRRRAGMEEQGNEAMEGKREGLAAGAAGRLWRLMSSSTRCFSSSEVARSSSTSLRIPSVPENEHRSGSDPPEFLLPHSRPLTSLPPSSSPAPTSPAPPASPPEANNSLYRSLSDCLL
eukprot:744666-Hanusia_phi.AAC.1